MTWVHCTSCGTTLQASAHRAGNCPRCLAEGEYPLPALAEGPPAEGVHPELDVVRRAFRLLELGQRDEMVSLFAEDFAGRTISTGELIEGRTGADAFMARANDGQSTLEATASRFEPNGRGQVGVFGRLRTRGPGGLVDIPAAWIYSVSNGRIHHAESFTSMARAQRALRPDEDERPG
jgi:ketosteroid isomerase-like protein